MIVDRHGRRHYPAGTPGSKGGEFAPRWPAGTPQARGDRFAVRGTVFLDDVSPPAAEWRPRRWRLEPQDAERVKAEADLREHVAKPEMEAWRTSRTAEEVETLIQEQLDLMFPAGERRMRGETVVYRNGPHQIRLPRGMREQVPVEEYAETLDALIEAFPPPSHRTVSFREAEDRDNVTVMLSGDAAVRLASTVVGGQTMSFTSHILDPAHNGDSGLAAGSYMPMRYHVSGHIWSLVHEYGHTVYPGEHHDTQPIWDAALEAVALDPTGMAMSEYGSLGGPHEQFAEAFAEWFLSGGRTDNVYAQVFARRFGWPQS